MIKPYYDQDGITIYCADCRDVLPLLEPGSIDLVLTDPDYNGKDIGVRSLNYGGKGKKEQLSQIEYKRFMLWWFSQCQRITSRVNLTPGCRNLWVYPPARLTLAWFKPGAVAYNQTGGFNIWEPVLVYGDCPRIHQDACEGIWTGGDLYYESTPLNFIREEWSKHPCPKHPGFWRWVLDKVGRPGEIVLDPFLGSGTTSRVAKDLGLKCVGIERVEEYCEIAVKRLAQGVLL